MGEVLFPESLAVFLFHTYDSIFPLLYLPFHSVFEIPIMPPRVIVVGAGLSGLSAAHTIYLAGGNVVLLDKNNFMGGNSTKAPNKKQEFKIPDQEYSLEEVAKHNKKEDLWIAVKGIVMNVTDWVDEHPGGPQALFSHMGKDASEEFEMLHDDE